MFSLFTRKRSKTPRPYVPLVNAELKGNAEESYKAAGCVFKSAHHILAGYQPKKKTPFISGIGGKKEANESFIDTALRETVEELFDPESPPEVIRGLIQDIKTDVTPSKIVQNGSYIIIIYSFERLIEILKLTKKHKLVSHVYETIPITLMDLVFKRNVRASAEISHLAILPLLEHNYKNPFVDAYFIKDMPILLKD